jgi:hypothetical protein
MPSSGHRKVLNAASIRSGLAIQKMSTARRGKIPAKMANRQPIASSTHAAAFSCATLGGPGASGITRKG